LLAYFDNPFSRRNAWIKIFYPIRIPKGRTKQRLVLQEETADGKV
jgi:hypothetical protein